MRRRALIVLALLAVACSSGQTDAPARAAPQQAATAALVSNSAVPKGLKRAIQRAAGYLKATTDRSGRFVYERALPGGRVPRPGRYNVLRHAGTIYALDHYLRFDPSDDGARDTLLRAARYLKRRHLRPIPGLDPSWRGIASLAGEESTTGRTEWKLGGAGLGLVALCRARGIDKTVVTLEELRGLARFIGFFQQPNGRYRAKYDARDRWKHDFFSLYYPGEATLGLLLLYAQDPDPQWLKLAADGVAALVRRRKNLAPAKVPVDHWLLIAIGELIPRYGELKPPPVSEADVRKQAAAIANRMFMSQRQVQGNPLTGPPDLWGSFRADGRSTPTATRLEGLNALWPLLPRDGPDRGYLRRQVFGSIRQGTQFLRRCQITRGDGVGGFPAGYRGIPGHPKFLARDAVIRVDFVQHALSALIGRARIAAQTGR